MNAKDFIQGFLFPLVILHGIIKCIVLAGKVIVTIIKEVLK